MVGNSNLYYDRCTYTINWIEYVSFKCKFLNLETN